MNDVVLLTGATGFVGKQVLRALGEENVSVRVALRKGSEIPSNISTKIDRIISSPDIFSESVEWWEQACIGVNCLIHIAWYVDPKDYLQSPRNFDCLIGSLNMAQGAALAGVRKFIGIGTCFEYDLSYGQLSVDTPLKPLTPYAGAKAAAYQFLSQYLPSRKVEFSWCRLFYLYGEGEYSRRLVSYIHQQLKADAPVYLTSGEQVRDFMDVSEAGKEIVKVALRDFKGAINICSGKAITVRQLAENIADQYGKRELLCFNQREKNLIDPDCVVGIKTWLGN